MLPRHNNENHLDTALDEPPRQSPAAPHPRSAEHQRAAGMRSAVDLCAEALIQAMVNARNF